MEQVLRRVVVGAVVAGLAGACRTEGTTGTGGADGLDGRASYVIAFLVSGPKVAEKSPEERRAIQAAHLANIGRLVDEGRMVIAGPFGHPSPDDSMRGIFVFDTPEVGVAREWTGTDPAVQAGVLGMELAVLRTWTELRRALKLYRENVAEHEGRADQDEMRGYAVVIAESGEGAGPALAGLRGSGKIVFEGSLVGSERGSYLVVLDAQDAEEGRDLLDPVAGDLGVHSVFPWWATGTLLGLESR